MTRGDLYLVRKHRGEDPKRQRVFAVVGRQVLIDSRFSSVICAPVFSAHDGLSTQVMVGVKEGLKKESSIHCDELVSLPKRLLTHYVGRMGALKLAEVDRALRIAVGLD